MGGDSVNIKLDSLYLCNAGYTQIPVHAVGWMGQRNTGKLPRVFCVSVFQKGILNTNSHRFFN